MSGKDTSKLPLSVLTAAAILFAGAALLFAQISMPVPETKGSQVAENAPGDDDVAPAPATVGPAETATMSGLPLPEPEETGTLPAAPEQIHETRDVAAGRAANPEREETPPSPAPETASALDQPETAASLAPVQDEAPAVSPPASIRTAETTPEIATSPEPAEVQVTTAVPRAVRETRVETEPRRPARVAGRPAEAPPAQSKTRFKPMTVGAAKEPIKSDKPDKPSVSAGAYAGKVHAAIARNRQRIKGASGSATVTFTIGPAGAISGARVTRSSGKPELDRAAVASVRGAALPAPPPGAKSTYSIQIYFR